MNEIEKLKDMLEFSRDFNENKDVYKNILSEEQFEETLNIERSAKELSSLPIKYNDLFLEYGWMAHESLNTEIMKKAIKVFESEGLETAEIYIMNNYEDMLKENLKFVLMPSVLYRRKRLIELSVKDYMEGRYHASIPVILMLLDGTLNDLQDSSLFSRNANLTTWDSLTGYKEGLESIIRKYNINRTKTNEEELEFPYRNGILHGRDLNYDNRKVALKSFAIMFYLSDWIRSYTSEEKRKKDYERKNSFTLNDYHEFMKNKVEGEKLQEIWKKRDPIIIEEPEVEKYNIETPEGTAIIFIDYIIKKNFGNPTEFFPDSSYSDTTKNQRIKYLKDTFRGRTIETIDKVKCIDIGSAKSEVEVELKYTSQLHSDRKENVKLHLLYEVNGKIENRLKEGGKWTIVNILAAADKLI